MAGIPGLFGLFTGWIGAATISTVPEHSVAATVTSPARSLEIYGVTRTATVNSPRKTHDE